MASAMAYDEEKGVPNPSTTKTTTEIETSPASSAHINTPSDDDSIKEYSGVPVHQDKGILSRLRTFEATLDRKLGVEAQAIARVRPDDKRPVPWHDQLTMALLWASGTMQISCFATGFIGSELGLNLAQSICITIFATLIGSACSGFCATMGPAMGLRQISISRYSFGWYPSKVIAALNVISQIGWSSVGCITGGLALSAVSDGRVSLILGVVIIAVGSLVVSFIGLRAILKLDKYAWFVFLILFLVMYGEAAGQAVPSAPATVSGSSLSGACLTLFAIVYGSSASWCSAAADYYVHYPIDTSKTKVFVLTTLGIALPTCIGMVLGCCVGSAMTVNTDWANTNENQGVGFLIQEILHPIGWAKFTLVILVLAGIAMNCINMYSCALSVQQFARPIAIIPRFFWAVIVFGVILAISIAGKDELLTVLQNLLALLGYWNTSFFVIVFAEHIVFRKRRIENYDLDGWNTPSRLPIGLAGGFAFLVGYAGWMVGMVTTWYVGPLAALIGENGGDIGNELAFVFTLLAYLPARYFELKKFGR